jgi:predicted metal-dependent hydrolase
LARRKAAPHVSYETGLRYSVIVQLGLPFEHDPPPLQFYFVRHRRARRYVLRVDGDGRVRVTIPRGGSRREAAEFGLRHLEWIANQRARLAPSRVNAVDRIAMRNRASVELRQRLLQLAADHGLDVSRISIRDQRARWGSCGHDGHICLNWRLVLMPPEIRDYVMIHELMHLRRMDHSRRYWELVAAAYPDYQRARVWLRQHGPSLR